MAKLPLTASVVVTFSVLGTGCADLKGPPGNPPPPPPEQISENPLAPKPQPDPEPVPPREPTVNHQVHADGSCWAYVEPVCPPNTPCNPPPPRQVDCTDEMLPAPSDAKMVALRSDGSCWEEPKVECSPGETCNPPPPHRVVCPPKADGDTTPDTDTP
jgi:hypothetical protein